MKTCVYVDAYNLYYGSLRGTPHKWLDLGALCKQLLPRDDVVRIRYCTAKVKPHPGKNGTDIRQETYLRALKTVPNLEIHLGHYPTAQDTHAPREPTSWRSRHCRRDAHGRERLGR